MLPKKLKKGDTIGIATPSSPILDNQNKYVDKAVVYFKTLGLNVIFAKNAFLKDK